MPGRNRIQNGRVEGERVIHRVELRVAWLQIVDLRAVEVVRSRDAKRTTTRKYDAVAHAQVAGGIGEGTGGRQHAGERNIADRHARTHQGLYQLLRVQHAAVDDELSA